MGLNLFGSSCSGGTCSTMRSSTPPNPNPKRFEVIHTLIAPKSTALVVRYPDCTNYEGRKVLVYDRHVSEILPTESLDPHFCDKGHPSPIARFEPTEKGWKLARDLAVKLSEK